MACSSPTTRASPRSRMDAVVGEPRSGWPPGPPAPPSRAEHNGWGRAARRLREPAGEGELFLVKLFVTGEKCVGLNPPPVAPATGSAGKSCSQHHWDPHPCLGASYSAGNKDFSKAGRKESKSQLRAKAPCTGLFPHSAKGAGERAGSNVPVQESQERAAPHTPARSRQRDMAQSKQFVSHQPDTKLLWGPSQH